MFRPLEELIHIYFARTWPIATCENQLDVINGGLIPILRMGASRHQIPHRLPACALVLAKHSTKQNLKTFPYTMAELCQSPRSYLK